MDEGRGIVMPRLRGNEAYVEDEGMLDHNRVYAWNEAMGAAVVRMGSMEQGRASTARAARRYETERTNP